MLSRLLADLILVTADYPRNSAANVGKRSSFDQILENTFLFLNVIFLRQVVCSEIPEEFDPGPDFGQFERVQ